MAATLFTIFATSDEQAMWRVQTQDDHEAFARLVERWEEPIRRLCVRMTGDEHRGEDLAQEAFTRVFAKRKDWRPDAKFSTWLWRVALNLCYDELRRVRRRGESSLDGDEAELGGGGGGDAPDRALMRREQGDQVRAALQRLAEPYRTVLVLRHYEGLKFREIADVLEVPEGTVKSRMFEALAQMTKLLQPMLDNEARPNLKTDRTAILI